MYGVVLLQLHASVGCVRFCQPQFTILSREEMQMSGRHTVTALSRHSQLAAIFIGRSTPQHRPALERRAQRYVYAQHQYCRHAGSEAAPRTLLDVLRSRSTVDCDTLDASVASSLGPFQDCTSNQAIAFAELQEHRHSDLVRRSASLAEELIPRYRDDGVSRDALAVEIRVRSLSHPPPLGDHWTDFISFAECLSDGVARTGNRASPERQYAYPSQSI